MTQTEILEVPFKEREIKIDQELRDQLLEQVNEESQVVVHFTYTAILHDKIRIWKSTFLFAKDSDHQSKLVHAENITFYPKWMDLPYGKTIHFTLIFTGLPKHCTQFDLIEQIPEPGGFEIRNIARNNTDVYMINLDYLN